MILRENWKAVSAVDGSSTPRISLNMVFYTAILPLIILDLGTAA
jgi:hypothetical protein